MTVKLWRLKRIRHVRVVRIEKHKMHTELRWANMLEDREGTGRADIKMNLMKSRWRMEKASMQK